MADIAPFRAIRYDPYRAGPLDTLTAPPYDVLSPADQSALYEASPANVVRLILNRAEPEDVSGREPYERAGKLLREWLADGTLVEDDRPALYVYRQRFADPDTGATLGRIGLVCALGLEPYASGVVLPHEETRTRARQDRLHLMRATDANTEPIFGLFEDADGAAMRCLLNASAGAPLMDVRLGSEQHTVWRTDSDETATHVAGALRASRVWIADGHHRYETSLTYRAERRDVRGDAGGADRILVVLVPFADPGLLVLPTHRLVKGVVPELIESLPAALGRRFVVVPVAPERLGDAMQAGVGGHRFGLLTENGGWVATLRDEGRMDVVAREHGPEWRRLDVSILQALVLDEALGIAEADLATTPSIAYTRDRHAAAEAVRSGECQAALLLNRPTADEVRRVALAGDKMPPKSTFFFPKLLSGLFLRRF